MKSYTFFFSSSWRDKPHKQLQIALFEALIKRGPRVACIVDGRPNALDNPIESLELFTWPSRRPTNPRDGLFLHKLIHQYRPVCLVSHFSAVNLMTVAGWLNRVPLRLAWHHTLIAQATLDTHMPRWKIAYLIWRKRQVFRLATHCLANSQATCQDLIENFGVPAKQCILFDFSLADPLKTLNPPARRDNLVVCVGRLDPSKGQDVLIRAGARLKHLPEMRIEFVGSGASQSKLELLAKEYEIEERCDFSGSVPHNEVFRKMASAAMTIVPSRHEAFGWVNVESLAVGTPVIASNTGGIPEIIRDGVDGFLVPPGDEAALAEKMELLLTQPRLREEMGRSARQRFLEAFEQEKSILRLADWLEALVETTLSRGKLGSV